MITGNWLRAYRAPFEAPEYSDPEAAATNHQTKSRVPTASATPVMRCKMDRAMVHWKR